ncbi:YdeI/OmpD-associated family protein [Nocardia carnea]|uniref:YdeI/OmpD-associated family protein n=1 Tax=Nocardia carnea TaxID=37328 RepID=UPI002455227B|nr:YdeI/OmpD-associated family protein [Nocardia carnea]
MTVGVELDTAERTGPVPGDLAAALAAVPGARAAFDAFRPGRERLGPRPAPSGQVRARPSY